MPPTAAPTATPDHTATHAQFFAQKGRQHGRQPLMLDVTGDGTPEYAYGSWDCGNCAIRWVTVFSGPNVIFDSLLDQNAHYLLPSIEALPDNKGFIVTEKKVVQPGETVDTATGRVLWTFRYNGSGFALVGKEETRVNTAAAPTTVVAPTAVPPPAAHAPYFTQKSRGGVGQPLAADVTGDGVAEYIYVTSNLGCGDCQLMWVTVFSGPSAIFDDNDYVQPTVEPLPDHSGFRIREKAAAPGESLGSTGERMVFTFRWNGSTGRFALAEQVAVAATVPAPPTTPVDPLAPPAAGSVPYAPTAAPSTAATQFKSRMTMHLDRLFPSINKVLNVCRTSDKDSCSVAYNDYVFSYATSAEQIDNMNNRTMPEQCRALRQSVYYLMGKGLEPFLTGPLVRDQNRNIIPPIAIAQAEYARQYLEQARSMIANDPGTCR